MWGDNRETGACLPCPHLESHAWGGPVAEEAAVASGRAGPGRQARGNPLPWDWSLPPPGGPSGASVHDSTWTDEGGVEPIQGGVAPRLAGTQGQATGPRGQPPVSHLDPPQGPRPPWPSPSHLRASATQTLQTATDQLRGQRGTLGGTTEPSAAPAQERGGQSPPPPHRLPGPPPLPQSLTPNALKQT